MFDAELYGNLLYGLRTGAGYRSAKKLAADLAPYDLGIYEYTIWAIESGEQQATAARHMAFVELLKPPPGYFEKALSKKEPEPSEDSGDG